MTALGKPKHGERLTSAVTHEEVAASVAVLELEAVREICGYRRIDLWDWATNFGEDGFWAAMVLVLRAEIVARDKLVHDLQAEVDHRGQLLGAATALLGLCSDEVGEALPEELADGIRELRRRVAELTDGGAS